MASARHPPFLVQIRQPGQARLGGRYTLGVSDHPGSGSNLPIGSNRRKGATLIVVSKHPRSGSDPPIGSDRRRGATMNVMVASEPMSIPGGIKLKGPNFDVWSLLEKAKRDILPVPLCNLM